MAKAQWRYGLKVCLFCLVYRVGQIKWHHFTFLLVTK